MLDDKASLVFLAGSDKIISYERLDMRSFIAIAIPDAIKAQLSAAVKRLSPQVSTGGRCHVVYEGSVSLDACVYGGDLTCYSSACIRKALATLCDASTL
jgi:hypothetical protein